MQTVKHGIVHGLRIILTQGFADLCILAHYLFTLSIPPTWRSGFLLSSLTSLHLFLCLTIQWSSSRYVRIQSRLNKVKIHIHEVHWRHWTGCRPPCWRYSFREKQVSWNAKIRKFLRHLLCVDRCISLARSSLQACVSYDLILLKRSILPTWRR